MSDTVLIALIAALSAIGGGLVTAIPVLLQQRRELEERKEARIEETVLALIKANTERVKLLRLGRGVYSTHEPPSELYMSYHALVKRAIENKGLVLSKQTTNTNTEPEATTQEPKD